MIVGAGPTGLTLAAYLARFGVSHRIVDKLAVPSDKSRALVVHVKSTELFQKLGAADELVAMGRKVLAASVYIQRETAFATEIGDIGVDDTPYPFVLFVSQAETERVLTNAVTAAGGVVERGIEVRSLETDANGVTAKLLHSATNSEETIRARFVVGCDGAHSIVRHSGDFEFEGEPYLQDFVLADAHLDIGAPRLHLCFDDDGLVALFPFKEENRWRVLATRADAPPAGPEGAKDPSLEEVQKLVERFTPFTAKLYDPKWLARFRLHHRQADKYRDDRLLLAGDAAHIHSPAGGQGMNTGIQDAANLAWKLALVAKHGANDALLDTYDEERHPVGAQLLRTTDRLFSMNTTKHRAVVALRNFVVRRIAPHIVKTRSRAAGFRFLSELDIAYPKSSIVIDRGGRGGVHAGERAPDAPLGEGTIFGATATVEHALLVFEGDDATAASDFAARMQAAKRIPVVRIVPKDAASARKRYGIAKEGVAVVRPDGYLGLRAEGLDSAAIDAYLARIFGAHG